MDRIINIRHLIILIISSLHGVTDAQQVSDTARVDKILKTEKVDVIKPFEAQLAEATMLPVNPRPSASKIQPPSESLSTEANPSFTNGGSTVFPWTGKPNLPLSFPLSVQRMLDPMMLS